MGRNKENKMKISAKELKVKGNRLLRTHACKDACKGIIEKKGNTERLIGVCWEIDEDEIGVAVYHNALGEVTQCVANEEEARQWAMDQVEINENQLEKQEFPTNITRYDVDRFLSTIFGTHYYRYIDISDREYQYHDDGSLAYDYQLCTGTDDPEQDMWIIINSVYRMLRINRRNPTKWVGYLSKMESIARAAMFDIINRDIYRKCKVSIETLHLKYAEMEDDFDVIDTLENEKENFDNIEELEGEYLID